MCILATRFLPSLHLQPDDGSWEALAEEQGGRPAQRLIAGLPKWTAPFAFEVRTRLSSAMRVYGRC